jgi:hypothetical protein
MFIGSPERGRGGESVNKYLDLAIALFALAATRVMAAEVRTENAVLTHVLTKSGFLAFSQLRLPPQR